MAPQFNDTQLGQLRIESHWHKGIIRASWIGSSNSIGAVSQQFLFIPIAQRGTRTRSVCDVWMRRSGTWLVCQPLNRFREMAHPAMYLPPCLVGQRKRLAVDVAYREMARPAGFNADVVSARVPRANAHTTMLFGPSIIGRAASHRLIEVFCVAERVRGLACVPIANHTAQSLAQLSCLEDASVQEQGVTNRSRRRRRWFRWIVGQEGRHMPRDARIRFVRQTPILENRDLLAQWSCIGWQTGKNPSTSSCWTSSRATSTVTVPPT